MTSPAWMKVAAKLLSTKQETRFKKFLGLEPAKCLEIALAGSKVSYLNRNAYNKLTPSQIKMLRELGISIKFGEHYAGGLVSVQDTTTNRTLNLTNLISFCQEETLNIISNPFHPNSCAFHKLLADYTLLRERLYLAIGGESSEARMINKILSDLKDTLSDIALLVLPPDFLDTVNNKQQFMSTICPNLGIYICSLTYPDEQYEDVKSHNQCPSSTQGNSRE